jgi:hypothetical protein
MKIDEFSTGIHIEYLPDGSWRSAGYAGGWMNFTIPSIPQPIADAISNKEFDAVEGYLNDRPAVIARLVNEEWATIAIVTRAIDNKSRPLPVYRYFICQGGLPAFLQIIFAIESYQEQNNASLPVFHPQSHEDYLNYYSDRGPRSVAPKLSEGEYSEIASKTTPIFLSPGKQCSLRDIHTLALRISNLHDRALAWAYNVESLERPDAFLLIKPASEEAWERLQKPKKVGLLSTYKQGVNDRALRTKIEAVVNNSGRNIISLKTALKNLEEELNNPNLDFKLWQEIFINAGAGQYTTNIHPNLAKLLVLKVLVIPSEFNYFLSWLNNLNKNKEPGKSCWEFFRELRETLDAYNFPRLHQNLEDAILKIFLPSLIK